MSEEVSGDVDTDADRSSHAGTDLAEAGTPRPRFVITGGGEPAAEQLAALVVALTPAPAKPPGAGPAAWRHAALLEGVGGPSILAPRDLDVASPHGR